MRPRLDPAMGETVICARVALQMAVQSHHKSPLKDMPPSQYAATAALHTPLRLNPLLRFSLHSLAVYLDIGMPSQTWLSNVLEAAHYGSSFRRCLFFAYKEQRGAYPRVTNRGVHSPSSASSARVRKGRLNA